MRSPDSLTMFALLRTLPTLALVAAMASAMLIACHSESKSDHAKSPAAPAAPAAPTAPASSRAALNGKWLLVALGDREIPASPPVLMIIAADDSLGGRSAVNGYNASLKPDGLDAGKFALTPIAATMMAGPPELMKLESQYFAALDRATSWRVEGETLSLGEGQAVVARFHRAAEEDIADVAWLASHVRAM